MAESSALCSSTFPLLLRSKQTFSAYSSKRFVFSSSCGKPSFHHSVRLVRCSAKDSKGGYLFGDDSFGFYPWDSSLPDEDSALQWVPEDRVTLFTTDGLIHIGGSMVPRRVSNTDQGRLKPHQRFQRQESDYMDPKQGLCLGALFNIAATNGLDMGRRLCIFGFCRSIEMLSDVVGDTVLENGGEIVVAEKAS